VDNYSRESDFATIKNFRLKIFWSKLLVDNYSRGNDFAAIKNFRLKIFWPNFYSITIPEEMILQR